MSESVQYLGGLEPETTKQIASAVTRFKTEIHLKEGNDVIVNEFDVFSKHHRGGDYKKPLAHRYRISIYLGDEKVEWPRKQGSYLTFNEVLNTLDNLTVVWNLLKNYRVKKAIEQKKRIGQLNKAAAVSEEELKKW